MSDLAAALQIAIKVHADQRDKQGQPYLLHVLRVVEAVSSNGSKVVAALHDAFEQGDWGANDTSKVCEALDQDEVAALDLLTHVGDDTYAEYIDRIADRFSPPATIAREVKLADLRDNLGRIPPEPDIRQVGNRSGHSDWFLRWGSLEARYERAITTLTTSPKEQT